MAASRADAQALLNVDGWWDVTDEASVAEAVVEDMAIQLERSGWPVLDPLFSRDVLMDHLQRGQLASMKRIYIEQFFSQAEALVLMESGPSSGLDSKLATVLQTARPAHRSHAERIAVWVRSEAEKSRPS